MTFPIHVSVFLCVNLDFHCECISVRIYRRVSTNKPGFNVISLQAELYLNKLVFVTLIFYFIILFILTIAISSKANLDSYSLSINVYIILFEATKDSCNARFFFCFVFIFVNLQIINAVYFLFLLTIILLKTCIMRELQLYCLIIKMSFFHSVLFVSYNYCFVFVFLFVIILFLIKKFYGRQNVCIKFWLISDSIFTENFIWMLLTEILTS